MSNDKRKNILVSKDAFIPIELPPIPRFEDVMAAIASATPASALSVDSFGDPPIVRRLASLALAAIQAEDAFQDALHALSSEEIQTLNEWAEKRRGSDEAEDAA